MDPVGSLIGSVLIGFGVILVYGAYRNKKVFGADGIIPQALATGSVTDLSNVSDVPVEGFGTGIGTGKQVVKMTPVDIAITRIKNADPTLGQDIESRVNVVTSDTTREQMIPLAQLLALAEAKGFAVSVETIRNHIMVVTGERI